MSQDRTQHSNNGSRMLILMGIIWLIFGGGLIIHQLITPSSVTVQWNTETELNTAGFNLFRSEIGMNDYIRVNENLINSEGDAVSGSSYSYVDDTVERGKTYDYLLEEIQNDGKANRYEDDKFSFTIPGMTWWSVILAAIAIVVGLALLVVGFKESKN